MCLILFRLKWLFTSSENLRTPANNGFAVVCAGSTLAFASTALVSGGSTSWSVTTAYNTGLSHQTGDPCALTIATTSVVDLAGNRMQNSASTDTSNAVVFGAFARSLLC